MTPPDAVRTRLALELVDASGAVRSACDWPVTSRACRADRVLEEWQDMHDEIAQRDPDGQRGLHVRASAYRINAKGRRL